MKTPIAHRRSILLSSVLVGVALGCNPPPKEAISPCAPGTTCLSVRPDGTPDPEGASVAQCRGVFPDYIVRANFVPPEYAGPWFELAQAFPQELPAPEALPWQDIDFKKSKEDADAYLYALRDYSFDGMIEAEFRPQDNTRRRWYHVPLMNFGHPRDLVHGLTEERDLEPGELGLKNTVKNYAVGLYNDVGAYTFGRVFEDPNAPDVSAGQFEEGAMVFKILFSAATPDDFEDPSNYLLEGAPEWQIATGARGPDGGTTLTDVRLLQMDIAVRDDRADTGWVFGTFAYDKDAPDQIAWNRLRPVGLMWGDDPGYTPKDQAEGKPLEESIVSDQIPAYAAGHLGWAGRVNGPVDNQVSACMSCHQVAQYPVVAQIAPFASSCDTDEKKLFWFRNLEPGEPFGAVDENCEPASAPAPLVSLDFSLQLKVALQSLLDYGNINPCLDNPVRAKSQRGVSAPRAPRVTR